MKLFPIHIENRTSLWHFQAGAIIRRASRLIFSSVKATKQPRKLSVIIKRLHPSSADANPTGWTGWPEDKISPIILRIADDGLAYPALYSQAPRLEYPHIEMQSPQEALFLIACHEFAHVALNCSGYGTARQYYNFPNFEEWVCENTAMCCLQIRRGNVKSSIL